MQNQQQIYDGENNNIHKLFNKESNNHTHTHTHTHTNTHTHTEWVLQEANKKIGTVSKSAYLDLKNENMIRGVFRYLTNIQDGAFAKIVKSNIIPM